jgi:hypothetical protein
MPVEIHVGQQVASIDRDATAALYVDTINLAGADECGCTNCKNFAAQRASAFPEEFLSLLQRVGANPSREFEAFDLGSGTEYPERHQYGGWFVLRGRIVEGADWRPEGRQQQFTYWFTDSFPSAGLAQDVCAIEFLCELPWVIPEPPEQNS